ncbi:MAG TPA: family 20 glycosylhydrolase [Steroidobacteraceae bacterium]
MQRTLLLLSLFFAAMNSPARADVPLVIPNPASVVARSGVFVVNDRTRLVIPPHDAGARRAAIFLSDLLDRTGAVHLKRSFGSPHGMEIELQRGLVPTNGTESYQLEVLASRILIRAPTDAGLLYGALTLWQLIPPGTAGQSATLPAILIDDGPRFRWRGLMLDSARHFQSPAYIRQFIDWMALHKLNMLHWHLTDDQAWRLQIKRYPRLTDVGAWRVPAGAAAAKDLDLSTGRPRQYGGFYTQQEVRQLVAYAAQRNITIVPEIEMPGHAVAAFVAYPELGCAATPHREVPSDWGIYSDPFNLDESTFRFLENVLTEVMQLFPSPYIHIGGDEVQTGQWVASAEVQARARALNLQDPQQLQPYFMQRISRFLLAHGRRPIGWDEMLQPGLPAGAIITSWHGISGGVAAAEQGNDSILSPWPTLYFDNRQSDSPLEPPGRGQVITLQDLYSFEPMPAQLGTQQQPHILGIQGDIWTEHIRTEAQLSEMTFPRAAVVAELGWSNPERRDWNGFLDRLVGLQLRYRALGIPHSESVFAVRTSATYDLRVETAQIQLANQSGYGEIHYTLDGAIPTAASPLYVTPLSVPMPAQLQAATFAHDVQLSPTLQQQVSVDHALHRVSQELKLCTQKIPLSLEDDAPVDGPRAVFLIDIENPCWIFEHADLDYVDTARVAVGQVPFNFQIGADRDKIPLLPPQTHDGEMQIRLDSCEGPLLASLPLTPALQSDAVTELPPAPLRGPAGIHDLCLRFTQASLDPMWAIDWIQLLRQTLPALQGTH